MIITSKSTSYGPFLKMESPASFDIIILGGGLSGFTAMHEICKADKSISVCLLEARARFGGRIKTVLDCNGKTLDMGGTWVGPQQKFIGNMLQELDIHTYKQYLGGVNLHDNGRTLSKYTGTIPSLPILTLLDTHFLLRKFNKLASMITVGSPEKCKYAKEWDALSVREYAKQKCWTTQAQNLISVTTRVVLGVEPEQISLLYFLNYVASAGGIEPLLDSENGAQDSRIEGGSATMLTKLREAIEASSPTRCVRFISEAQVVSIAVSSKGPRDSATSLTCRNGAVFTAKRLVCCCPPSCLARIDFSPPAPAWKRSLWNRSHAGCWTKVIVQYAVPFWRTAGFSGSVVCEHPSAEKPLSCLFDYCDHDGGRPALVGFIPGNSGVGFADMLPSVQRERVIRHLVQIFGADAAEEHVSRFHAIDWLHDPEARLIGSGGCPVDITAIGFFVEQAKYLRQPLTICDCTTAITTGNNGNTGTEVSIDEKCQLVMEVTDDWMACSIKASNSLSGSTANPLISSALNNATSAEVTPTLAAAKPTSTTALAQFASSSGAPSSSIATPLLSNDTFENRQGWKVHGASAALKRSTAAAERPPCVFFAGTETATKWIGYMDGAIEAGKRSAVEVLLSLN